LTRRAKRGEQKQARAIVAFLARQDKRPVSRQALVAGTHARRSLDKEAKRLGVPRQSLIKVLIARHLEEL